MSASVALEQDSNSFQSHSSSETQREGNSCGRFFQKIGNGFADAGGGAFKGVKKVMIALGHMRSDPNTFGRVLGLGVTAFSLIEMSIGKPGVFGKVTSRLLMTNSMIDNFQVFDSTGYFGAGKWQKNSKADKSERDSNYTIAGQACFLAASVGGLALFLGKMTFLNLSKVSAAIGSVPILGMAARLGIGFGTAITGLVGVGYASFGADAAKKLLHKQTSGREKAQARWDIARCASEVIFKTYIVTGSILGLTNPVGLVALGSTSAVLGIASFLHSKKPKAA
jgi:hypothetical protein